MYETKPEPVTAWVAQANMVVKCGAYGANSAYDLVVAKGDYVVEHTDGFVETLSPTEFSLRYRTQHVCPTMNWTLPNQAPNTNPYLYRSYDTTATATYQLPTQHTT